MSYTHLQEGSPTPPPNLRANQEEEIQAVVLLHLIKPSTELLPRVVFIYTDSKDPSPQFLQRFLAHHVEAKPGSQVGWGYMKFYASLAPDSPSIDDFLEEVIDPATGESSSLYSVGPIKWLNDTTAQLSGGCTFHSLAGYSKDFEVRWDGQNWNITEEVDGWIF